MRICSKSFSYLRQSSFYFSSAFWVSFLMVVTRSCSYCSRSLISFFFRSLTSFTYSARICFCCMIFILAVNFSFYSLFQSFSARSRTILSYSACFFHSRCLNSFWLWIYYWYISIKSLRGGGLTSFFFSSEALNLLISTQPSPSEHELRELEDFREGGFFVNCWVWGAGNDGLVKPTIEFLPFLSWPDRVISGNLSYEVNELPLLLLRPR